MNIVMMGVQGSGKGTQSKRLADDLGLPHVSTGDLFRDNIARGTDLGRRAQEYTDQGELVPDAIVIDMVKDRLARDDCADGCILDGFPRSAVQLAALEFLAPVDRAVLIELDDDTAVRRLTERAECRDCGILYGANRKPKVDNICDECGKALKIRSDDTNVEAVRKRLAIYHGEVDVLVRYYDWKSVLRRVDGDATVDEVFARIKAALA